MGTESTTAKQLRLDERNHVEKPLLDQLAGLGWEVIDLTDMKQTPADTHRESFTEVVMTAGAARAAQGHQPLARRPSRRGGREAAHRELPEHRFAGEQQAPVPAPAGEHQRQREPSERREEPDRPFRGLCDPRQQPLHRGLPVQGPRPRHRAPHHPRPRAVPQRPASSGDRVQIAQGQGRDFPRRSISFSATASSAGPRGKGMRRSSTTTRSSWRPAGRKPSSAPSPRTRRSTSIAGPTRIHEPWTSWTTAQAAPTTSSVLVAGIPDRDNLLDLMSDSSWSWSARTRARDGSRIGRKNTQTRPRPSDGYWCDFEATLVGSALAQGSVFSSIRERKSAPVRRSAATVMARAGLGAR